MTLPCAGRTLGENLAAVPELQAGQDVILPLETPIKSTGHIQILYGNLAPEGSVAKITGGWSLFQSRAKGTFRLYVATLRQRCLQAKLQVVLFPVGPTGKKNTHVLLANMLQEFNATMAIKLFLLFCMISAPVCHD